MHTHTHTHRVWILCFAAYLSTAIQIFPVLLQDLMADKYNCHTYTLLNLLYHTLTCKRLFQTHEHTFTSTQQVFKSRHRSHANWLDRSLKLHALNWQITGLICSLDMANTVTWSKTDASRFWKNCFWLLLSDITRGIIPVYLFIKGWFPFSLYNH